MKRLHKKFLASYTCFLCVVWGLATGYASAPSAPSGQGDAVQTFTDALKLPYVQWLRDRPKGESDAEWGKQLSKMIHEEFSKVKGDGVFASLKEKDLEGVKRDLMAYKPPVLDRVLQ